MVDADLLRLDNRAAMALGKRLVVGAVVGLIAMTVMAAALSIQRSEPRRSATPAGRFQRYVTETGRTMRRDAATGATCILERNPGELVTHLQIQKGDPTPDTVYARNDALNELLECAAQDNPARVAILEGVVEAADARRRTQTK